MIAPVIKTDRLVLRGFQLDDLGPLTAFFADEAATRFIGGTRTPVQVHALLSAFVGHWQLDRLGFWAIEEQGGALVGYTGYLNPPDWPEPEIGWNVFPAFQGRGYATEAARASRTAITRLGGPDRLVSYIDPDNAASIRVAEKLGAVADRRIELRGGLAVVWRHPSAGISRGQAA